MMLQDQSMVNSAHSAIQSRISSTDASGLHQRPPSTEAQKPSVTLQSSLINLAPMLREDISQLWLSLGSTQCVAAITSAHDGASATLAGDASTVDDERFVHYIGAPIFNPLGVAAGTALVRYGAAALYQVTPDFLSSILNLTVDIIAERWFRMHFRRHWVLAAQRRNGDKLQRLLLALDRERRIVGADRQTRAALAHASCDAFDRVPLSVVFSTEAPRLKVAARDVAQSFVAADGGEPWVGLLTPPCLGTGSRSDDLRLRLQTRPRFHLLSARANSVDSTRASAGLAPHTLRRVLERIDTDLAATMSVHELARIAGISSSHFARSFLRSVGATPHNYIMQRRLDKARELLEKSSLPLAEIALITGFSDQSHFSRRFQSSSGIAPLRYRKMHR